jgi:ligand-binding sensor domain-containing protein
MADVIFVSSSEGLTVLEKSNGGFKVARRALEGTRVTACAADPDGTGYIGTFKGLFKTTDNGKS